MSRFLRLVFPLAAAVLMIFPHAVFAGSSGGPAPLDTAGLSGMLDSLIVPGLERQHIPGMVVVVVQDSSILIARGYGFADVEHRIPWSADSTVIRIASVSKLFTGTAVMQLVEQGKLKLFTDVNSYLTRFKLEERPGGPVTLHNLLTHTAGFDDRYIGKSARTQREQEPLGDFLAHHLPPRILPANQVFVYSNISNALAGFIVEEAAHEDFAAYVRRNILEPLQMYRSDYRLRPELEPLLARSYTYDGKAFRSHPFDFINDYPGGQMLSTGTDMAKFMMAHLNLGEYGGRRILREETARMMHAVQFTHHPALHGAAGYSWGIDRVRGQKVLQHAGGYLGVSSRLVLFPERRIGLFVACNIADGSLVSATVNRLVERLVPPEPPDSTAYPRRDLAAYDRDVDPFVGTYRPARYAHGTMEKVAVLAGLTGGELEIRRNTEGMILMPTLTGTWRRMVQTEPALFESVDDRYACAFRRAKTGDVTHLFTNGTTAFEKIAWYETAFVQCMLFGICIMAFALVALIVPVIRLFRKEERPRIGQRPVRWFAEKAAGVFLLYVLALGVVVVFVIPQEELMLGFAYGMHWGMYVAQTIALIGVLLLAGLAGSLYGSVSGSRGTASVHATGDRIAGAVMLAAGIAFIWFLAYWNLLGYRFG